MPSKLTLTLAVTLAFAMVAHANYESPPIWDGPVGKRAEPAQDEFIPIQYRGGAARGPNPGLGRGVERRRRQLSAEQGSNRIEKRAVIFDKDAHLSLEKTFDLETAATVDTTIPDLNIDFKKRTLVKRSDFDDLEGEEFTEATEEEINAGPVEGEDDDEVYSDDEEEERENGSLVDLEFEGNLEEEDQVYTAFGEQEDVDEEEEDDESDKEDGEDFSTEDEDEEEERRLDNEAGFQDWIEEMKSEEYFDLAGHPDGAEQEEEEEGEAVHDDEPSPSEEEIFAASWGNQDETTA